METFDLATIEKADAVQVFTGGGVDPLLAQIAAECRAHVSDVKTDKGRKDIASLAYKVSQSKVLLDKAGKQLVEDWKTSAKKVDDVRKHLRDTLEALRDEVRLPLDQWEESERARLAAVKLAAERETAHGEALAENALFDRLKEVERKEAELAKIEAERQAKEDAERKEKERNEYEARIAKEAEERAIKQERERAEAERQESERREFAALEAAKQAERNRIAAEERARIEKEQAAIKAAEEKEKAVRDAQEVAAMAALLKEKERVQAEEAELKAKAMKAADKEHRRKINTAILFGLVASGVSDAQGKAVIAAIVVGSIPHIRIEY